MATLQKVESPNHTAGQVAEILTEAYQLTLAAELPERFKVEAFVQACQLLGQKSVSFVAEQSLPAMSIPGLRRG